MRQVVNSACIGDPQDIVVLYGADRPRRRGDRMKRRDFFALLGSAAIAGPLVAHAQQKAMPVIGVLSSGESRPNGGFYQGLRETGYVERENLGNYIFHYPRFPRYNRRVIKGFGMSKSTISTYQLFEMVADAEAGRLWLER